MIVLLTVSYRTIQLMYCRTANYLILFSGGGGGITWGSYSCNGDKQATRSQDCPSCTRVRFVVTQQIRSGGFL